MVFLDIKKCCKGLNVLLDTRCQTLEISDNRFYEEYKFEFEKLFEQIISKGSMHYSKIGNCNLNNQLTYEIRKSYNETFNQAMPYNQLFIYDKSKNLTRLKLYISSIKKLIKFEDVFLRLLYLNYKYLYKNMLSYNQDFVTAIAKITQIETPLSLIYPLQKISKIVHTKLCERLNDCSICYPFLDLAPLNLEDIKFDARFVLDRVLSCLKAKKNLMENGVVILSKDPAEPFGGMCRYWCFKVPFLLFCPYYKGLISALTFTHEIGHLIHYKTIYKETEAVAIHPVVEEFFAIYAELTCLKMNVFGLSKSASEIAFWQRIWYLIVRQFQVFLFEKMNFSDSIHNVLDSNVLRNHWYHSWELALNESLKFNDLFLNSWVLLKGIINLPFRSISYVLATITALWIVLKNRTLPKDVYFAKDIRSLFNFLGIPSIEHLLEDTVRLIK